MPSNDFRLITLGRVALVGPHGGEDESLGKRRRKLALLTVLALSPRPLSRDSLAEMFWGDEDDERARHSLSDALSHLRRALGRDAITSRREEVSIAPDAPLTVDLRELSAAAAAEDWTRVVELYAGPFLDGVHVTGSPRFDQWATAERARAERLFLKACDACCFAHARARRWDECEVLAARWLAAAPLSADAALYLLNAIKAPGTREADARALDAYRALGARLDHEYESAPDARVAALASDIASRLQESRAASASAPASAERGSATPAAATESPPLVTSGGESERDTDASASVANFSPPEKGIGRASGVHRWKLARGRGVLLSLAAAALLAIGGAVLARDRIFARRTPASGKPVIAVAAIQVVPGDTGSLWLEEGMKQMIAADLSRSSAVDVVPPTRVREEAARSHAEPSGARPLEQVLRIGRDVGATWVMTGGLTHGDTMYVLDVSLYDVATARTVRLYTVTGTSLSSIADRAASRVLGATQAGLAGPGLAGIETPSMEAYEHYVRAVQASGEGRFADERREIDAALARDSGFVSAIYYRMQMAWGERDFALVARLTAALTRAGTRASEWDKLGQAFYAAEHNGEMRRSEQLARTLVARFPYDPRAYSRLSDVLANEGRWAEADTVLLRELTLDSLAAEAGDGPCVPCAAYGGLIGVRMTDGDLPGAERMVKRWVRIQPDLPAAWSALSWVREAQQRFDEAIAAQRRAAMLAGPGDVYELRLGRQLLEARRYQDVDSMIASWRSSGVRALEENAADLEIMLLRERGRLRESNRVIDSVTARFPGAQSFLLMRGWAMGRLGDERGARLLFERYAHQPTGEPPSPLSALDGDAARGFCWEHALEADAIAAYADTTYLRALADSVALISMRSYYGRDKRLSHHIRALIAERGGRLKEAERELEAARWGAGGWTRTEAELAKVRLALGRPADAIATLRAAYAVPLDAMGRYEPRSELDLLMARAFRDAGESDSAAKYAAYVRRAWSSADAELRVALLAYDKSAEPAVLKSVQNEHNGQHISAEILDQSPQLNH